MAQQVVNKKVPTLMAAIMIGTQLGGNKEPKEQMKLKLRMKKLKESIIREATIREAQMHDREEKMVLQSVLEAVSTESIDAEKCKDILQERLKHLSRRIAQSHIINQKLEESSSDEEEEEEDKQLAVEGKHSPRMLKDQDVSTASYWTNIASDRGAITAMDLGQKERSMFDNANANVYRSQLHKRGFLSLPDVLPDTLAAKVLDLIKIVESHNWPPIFAFMYDEPWRVINSVWKHVEQLLGGPCLLEPSFTAFHLNHRKEQEGLKYMGTNFALPHRDYTYSDSVFSDGNPKILSVWLPLNKVTLENGCMYVVPREFDSNFDKDGAYEHLQVLTEGGLKGTQFLHFPLNGIQPLPGDAGSFMCWFGNCIHWGSSCHATGANDPRASIALVFRRADAFQDKQHQCMSQSDISLALQSTKSRLKLIHEAIGYFKHWYKVPEDLSKLLKELDVHKGSPTQM